MESCGNSITGVSDSLGMESTVAGKRVEGTRRCGEAREGLRYSRLRCLKVGVPGGEGEDGSGGGPWGCWGWGWGEGLRSCPRATAEGLG